MGWFRDGLGSFITALRRTTPDRGWAPRMPWLGRTTAGVPVNPDIALTYAAIWACVQVICGSVSQMGWHVYRSVGRGRERVSSHPVDWLLDTQPNEEMTAFNFRESILASGLLRGNGYAEIERDMAGRAVALWPIAKDRVNVDRTLAGALIYDIANRGGPNTQIDPMNMFHLRGLGDGVEGLSVVSYARQSIGLGLATEKMGASLFGNGARPSIAVEHPAVLGDKAYENLKKSIMEKIGGDNMLSPLILEEGMKLHTYSINPDDAQFLETRAFQILEICRWFNVKPHKIAELTRATFSNIEEQNIEHVVDTCLPWVLRMEQEANIKLFGTNRQGLYTKMNVASLLRGKLSERYAAYGQGRQWGWLSVNDIRQWEDLNPLPPHIGDIYLSPTNMLGIPIDPNAPILGAPAPPPAPPNEEEDDEVEDRLRKILALRMAERKEHRNGVLS